MLRKAEQKEKEVRTLMTLWATTLTLNFLALDLFCMTEKTYLCLSHCYLGILLLVAKHNSHLVRLEAGVQVCVYLCVLESRTENKQIGGLRICIALKSFMN